MSNSSVAIHPEKSPLAGQTVTADLGQGEAQIVIEDWWDRVFGESWKWAKGHPACFNYAMRTAVLIARGANIPSDDEVLYGHISGIGHLIHVSEIKAGVSA